ncbi:MAG: sugar phosphate isomerase/epimerase [Phycisphaerae bacterium]|nr:sugar phosphate isomerase/epimerase [Phycisphaerae bacterium]
MHTANECLAAESTSKPTWLIACRDANLQEVGEPDTWAAMKAIDVDGTEVSVMLDGTCPHLFGPKKYSIATPDDVKALHEDLQANGCRIGAFCLHNHFDERPDEEVELVVKAAKAARVLGVPALRLDVVARKIKDVDEFLTFAVGIGRRIVKATEDAPVRFGVENHGAITNRPEFLRKMFDGVGSKRFGLTLDTANFYWFGHPLSKLYSIFEEFAPVACHTHCKSIHYPEAEREKQRLMGWEYEKYFCPVYEGDIDFKRLAAIFAKAGYEGDLCIENESLRRAPKEKRREILEKEVAFLRGLL